MRFQVFILIAFCLLASCSPAPVAETAAVNEESAAPGSESPGANSDSYSRFLAMSGTELCQVRRSAGMGSEDWRNAEIALVDRGEYTCGSQSIGPESFSARRTYTRPVLARYSVRGHDRDCGDFSSAGAAQAFFLANGGPASDPHGLDRDGDGYACDWGRNVQTAVNHRRVAVRQASAARVRRTPSYSSGGRCHWVSGYTRRNGTYVRGHQRCR